MWVANAATVSPSPDTADGRVHFTPANLASHFHRALEAPTTTAILRAIFADAERFVVHDALPSSPQTGDEGAANHTRLATDPAGAAVEFFVYGRRAYGPGPAPAHFPARQTFEASAAIARRHELDPARVVFAQQHPQAIDAGVFHNDVIAVGHRDVLLCHERAFVDTHAVLADLAQRVGPAFSPIVVRTAQVPLEDAVATYLFNSQLVDRAQGGLLLVAPAECRENARVSAFLDGLVADGGPIREVVAFDLRQSMRNGGGPACLRLRVALTASERAAVTRERVPRRRARECAGRVDPPALPRSARARGPRRSRAARRVAAGAGRGDAAAAIGKRLSVPAGRDVRWRRRDLVTSGSSSFSEHPAMAANTLKQRLASRALLVAPGVYDMVSLRLANTFGFEALYMTGYGTVASHLGLPDAGLATYTEMVGRVRSMASQAAAPLIADGDTGYGGLLNVRHTVRGYEEAGASAIQLEDQEFPKKCGHTPGRRVIPAEDMVKKIRVAVESRSSPDFLIVARTDARTALGLDEALRRADAYANAGADVLFIESPESVEEMRIIGARFDLPLVANMVEKGRTPVLAKADLEAIGYRMAIFPVAALLAAVHAMAGVYGHLKATGSSLGAPAPLYDFTELSLLMGFQDVWDFEKKHAN